MLHVSHVYNMLLVHMFVIDINICMLGTYNPCESLLTCGTIESLDQTGKPQLGKRPTMDGAIIGSFCVEKPSIKRPSGRKSYTNAYRQ